MLEFIFLNRKWEKDQKILTRAMNRMQNDHSPMWFLLFPEGTLVMEETRAISKKYADKIGRKVGFLSADPPHQSVRCVQITPYAHPIHALGLLNLQRFNSSTRCLFRLF